MRSHTGYERILDTAIQPSNKSSLATNIQILEALIKVANETGPGEYVGYGKGGEKGEEAVKIKVNNTDVSLTESDLSNLSTLLDALSLQGVNFGPTRTGINPTKQPAARPQVGGRTIKTELYNENE